MSQLGVLTQTTLLSATTGTLPGYLLPVWQKTVCRRPAFWMSFLPKDDGGKKEERAAWHHHVQDKKLPVFSFEILNGASSSPEAKDCRHPFRGDGRETTSHGIACRRTPSPSRSRFQNWKTWSGR